MQKVKIEILENRGKHTDTNLKGTAHMVYVNVNAEAKNKENLKPPTDFTAKVKYTLN